MGEIIVFCKLSCIYLKRITEYLFVKYQIK